MRIISRILLPLLLLSLAGCENVFKRELPANIVLGNTYYTQSVMRYQNGMYSTVNYLSGTPIPVNTAVTLLAVSDETINVQLNDSQQKIQVKNTDVFNENETLDQFSGDAYPNHWGEAQQDRGEDIYQVFNRLFGRQKVDLSQFTPLERQHIADGTVANGMTEKAVRVALGRPSFTETMNLAYDTWVYWINRFDRFDVKFDNGKVVRTEKLNGLGFPEE